MTSPIDDLVTIRDWLRYAVSRFNAAGLVYGHGTERALDEAAFLILATLKLPIHELDPWLEARLTREERARIADLIETRISTRKPAPYLVGEAWIKDFRFVIDERAIVPRSYLGELMVNGLEAVLGDTSEIGRVLDLCTGAAPLAIIAAHVFPDAQVDAVELSPAALEVARRNVTEYGLEDRVHLLEGDLYAPVAKRRYDLILANPPYVTDDGGCGLPTGIPGRAQARACRRRRWARSRPPHSRWRAATPNGSRSSDRRGRHGQPALEAAYPDLPFLWLDTETSEGEVFHLEAKELAPAGRGKGKNKG